MKKKLISILIGICMLVMGGGCTLDPHNVWFPEKHTTNDGLLEYFYAADYLYANKEEEQYYVIMGAVAELPETLYIPAYYNGKEVRDISYRYGHHYVGLRMQGVTTVYLPYSVDLRGEKLANYPIALISYLTCNSIDMKDYYDYSNFWAGEEGKRVLYMTELLYANVIEYYKQMYKQYFEGIVCESAEYYMKLNTMEDIFVTIQIANISYMFNYEDCLNDGYFFIDNRDYGAKIKDTPYEPLRDGYTFAGWYKEPECIHKWDFDKDTLPEAKYNEQGGMIYQETKLYAKWIEK